MSGFGEVIIKAECNICAKKRKTPVFPKIKSMSVCGEEPPTFGYYFECPKCGARTTFYPSIKEAQDAWNKHEIKIPTKKKK